MREELKMRTSGKLDPYSAPYECFSFAPRVVLTTSRRVYSQLRKPLTLICISNDERTGEERKTVEKGAITSTQLRVFFNR